MVDLVGLEDLDGKKVYHLRVQRKTLPPQDLYLDSTSYLEKKMSTTVPGSGVMEVIFGDYRTVDGFTMPHSLKSVAAGMTVSEMKIDKIEFNVKLDDAPSRSQIGTLFFLEVDTANPSESVVCSLDFQEKRSSQPICSFSR
jgi:hypothetical protein